MFDNYVDSELIISDSTSRPADVKTRSSPGVFTRLESGEHGRLMLVPIREKSQAAKLYG